eukprot:CAMPEP_0179313728 /NCGR_PEP_ID=MMETSP0797-20121207/53990_1 /TAXON_ID=47934 /ORGANISM="Dinophysis acuminata, Strain DAEP01" /LENGTH=32 /DNA_ID= /DNA_START= /DNA_END= /DNA_ORIENTATION=
MTPSKLKPQGASETWACNPLGKRTHASRVADL